MSGITSTVVYNHPPIDHFSCECGWSFDPLLSYGPKSYSEHLLNEIDQARVINDVDDLEELPKGAFIRDSNGTCFSILNSGKFSIYPVFPPFTVLYAPNAEKE